MFLSWKAQKNIVFLISSNLQSANRFSIKIKEGFKSYVKINVVLLCEVCVSVSRYSRFILNGRTSLFITPYKTSKCKVNAYRFPNWVYWNPVIRSSLSFTVNGRLRDQHNKTVSRRSFLKGEMLYIHTKLYV